MDQTQTHVFSRANYLWLEICEKQTQDGSPVLILGPPITRSPLCNKMDKRASP